MERSAKKGERIGGHNVVAMRLERESAAAGRKLRDRVALIEILPILRKAAEKRTEKRTKEHSILWPELKGALAFDSRVSPMDGAKLSSVHAQNARLSRGNQSHKFQMRR